MTISVIVRAAEQALQAGRLAGEVEIVATGEKTVVSSASELVEFLRKPPHEPEGADPERSPSSDRPRPASNSEQP